MDALKNAMGIGGGNQQGAGSQQGLNQPGSASMPTEQKQGGGGGFLGGLGDKFNSAAGGGRESEKNEDYLDKGTLQSTIPPFLGWISAFMKPITWDNSNLHNLSSSTCH